MSYSVFPAPFVPCPDCCECDIVLREAKGHRNPDTGAWVVDSLGALVDLNNYVAFKGEYGLPNGYFAISTQWKTGDIADAPVKIFNLLVYVRGGSKVVVCDRPQHPTGYTRAWPAGVDAGTSDIWAVFDPTLAFVECNFSSSVYFKQGHSGAFKNNVMAGSGFVSRTYTDFDGIFWYSEPTQPYTFASAAAVANGAQPWTANLFYTGYASRWTWTAALGFHQIERFPVDNHFLGVAGGRVICSETVRQQSQWRVYFPWLASRYPTITAGVFTGFNTQAKIYGNPADGTLGPSTGMEGGGGVCPIISHVNASYGPENITATALALLSQRGTIGVPQAGHYWQGKFGDIYDQFSDADLPFPYNPPVDLTGYKARKVAQGVIPSAHSSLTQKAWAGVEVTTDNSDQPAYAAPAGSTKLYLGADNLGHPVGSPPDRANGGFTATIDKHTPGAVATVVITHADLTTAFLHLSVPRGAYYLYAYLYWTSNPGGGVMLKRTCSYTNLTAYNGSYPVTIPAGSGFLRVIITADSLVACSGATPFPDDSQYTQYVTLSDSSYNWCHYFLITDATPSDFANTFAGYTDKPNVVLAHGREVDQFYRYTAAAYDGFTAIMTQANYKYSYDYSPASPVIYSAAGVLHDYNTISEDMRWAGASDIGVKVDLNDFLNSLNGTIGMPPLQRTAYTRFSPAADLLNGGGTRLAIEHASDTVHKVFDYGPSNITPTFRNQPTTNIRDPGTGLTRTKVTDIRDWRTFKLADGTVSVWSIGPWGAMTDLIDSRDGYVWTSWRTGVTRARTKNSIDGVFYTTGLLMQGGDGSEYWTEDIAIRFDPALGTLSPADNAPIVPDLASSTDLNAYLFSLVFTYQPNTAGFSLAVTDDLITARVSKEGISPATWPIDYAQVSYGLAVARPFGLVQLADGHVLALLRGRLDVRTTQGVRVPAC